VSSPSQSSQHKAEIRTQRFSRLLVAVFWGGRNLGEVPFAPLLVLRLARVVPSLTFVAMQRVEHARLSVRVAMKNLAHRAALEASRVVTATAIRSPSQIGSCARRGLDRR